MKGGEKLFTIVGVLILLMLILPLPITSAGFLDNLRGKITGFVTNTTNITVTVAGTNPVTIAVKNETMTGTDVTPVTNTFVRVKFFVTVTDPDGQADINTTSVNASIGYHETGEATRTNGSYNCIDKGNIDSTSRNFSCSVDMWFFDAPSIWNVTVYARDNGALTNVANSSQTFSYATLQSTLINPQSLTFPSAAIGATNITSDNDPLFINNTGNANFTAISINSTALPGATNASEFINGSNFSVGVTSLPAVEEECGTGVASDTTSNDTQLADQVFKLLDIANLTRGNYSAVANKNVSGQEGLFFCIQEIPSDISSQTYATDADRAWTIQLTI